MTREFSVKSKKLIQLSREQAIMNGSDVIDIVHFMLAYIDLRKNDEPNLFFEPIAFVTKEWRNKGREIELPHTEGNIPLSKNAEKALKKSFREVANKNPGIVILPEHILLSMIKVDNENSKQFDLDYYDLKARYKIEGEQFPDSSSSHIELNPESNSSPIDIYFNLEEYSIEEIIDVLLELSEVYNALGGDHLEIKGMETFEFENCTNPVMA